MEEKKFTGAPFGIQKPRFEVAGIHPTRKLPGTFTQVSYDKKSMSPLNRKLGPGTYNLDYGGFSEKSIQERSSGPGWEIGYKLAQEAMIPHFLFCNEWDKKQMLKKQLGPGTYNVHDSFYDLSNKPRSIKGVCQTAAKRFDISEKNTVPGPGTYGIGGIPHAAMEEKEKKSPGIIGILDSASSGKRCATEIGSGLCPGQYNYKSFTDELRERLVSKRGPYDLFTGDRNALISVGRFSAHINNQMEPGMYKCKSFLDPDDHKKTHGKFSKVQRMPTVPTERIYCKTLSQWPRNANEPGPGSYDPRDVRQLVYCSRPAFGSSASRVDKNAESLFLGSYGTVGPGRYEVCRHSKNSNGNRSVFISNTKRWDASRDIFLMERIRSKNTLSKTNKRILSF
ncbi:ciliary microtubule-associated protein 2 isoform X2 [Hydra vulgaris]|uniref:Ciliary microtubule-associated protein 2 isoform X2 n=1 Tax=Hydra vulgaris TaxID=6087 RepID=A0ABM4C7Y0_HYDVU